MSTSLMSLDALKQRAKSLRKALAETGHAVSHSQSLELLAKQLGHRDWNTLHASLGNRLPLPFQVGQRVSGRYLGQPFQGELTAVAKRSADGRFIVNVRFDTPIDVIVFDSMTNFRSYAKAVVNQDGYTVEKTSNGEPHLVFDMPTRAR